MLHLSSGNHYDFWSVSSRKEPGWSIMVAHEEVNSLSLGDDCKVFTISRFLVACLSSTGTWSWLSAGLAWVWATVHYLRIHMLESSGIKLLASVSCATSGLVLPSCSWGCRAGCRHPGHLQKRHLSLSGKFLSKSLVWVLSVPESSAECEWATVCLRAINRLW